MSRRSPKPPAFLVCLLFAAITIAAGEVEIPEETGHAAEASSARVEISDDFFRAFPVLRADSTYIGTLKGLLSFNPMQGDWVAYTTAEGLPENHILALVSQGPFIYAGTPRGLARLNPATERWQVFSTSDGLPHDYISGLAVTEDYVYIATAGGACRLDIDSDRVTSLPVFEADGVGVPGMRVDDAVTIGGEVWFAASGGLARFDERTESWETLVSGKRLPEGAWYRLYSSGDFVYAWGKAGLLRLNRKTFKYVLYDGDEALNGGELQGVTVDGSSLWLATDAGLFSLDTASGVLEQFTYGGGFLVDEDVRATFKDGDTLWVTTADVLYAYDTAARTYTSYEEGYELAAAEYQALVFSSGWVLLVHLGSAESFNPATREVRAFEIEERAPRGRSTANVQSIMDASASRTWASDGSVSTSHNTRVEFTFGYGQTLEEGRGLDTSFSMRLEEDGLAERHYDFLYRGNRRDGLEEIRGSDELPFHKPLPHQSLTGEATVNGLRARVGAAASRERPADKRLHIEVTAGNRAGARASDTFRGKVSTIYSLSHGNVIPGTERVKVDGRLLSANKDYLMIYPTGQLGFLNPDLICETTLIFVDYEYERNPFSAGAGTGTILDLLPEDDEVGNWVRTGALIRADTSAELEAVIDGEAPAFYAYNWQESAFQDYTSSGRTINLEIFDQDNSTNAEGIYDDRTPGGTTALTSIGDETSINDSLPAAYVVYMRTDKYFCRITIDEKTPSSRSEIILFASAVAQGAQAGISGLLDLFPESNEVGDWTKSGAFVRADTNAELEAVIDGEAPAYYAYDWQESGFQDYTSSGMTISTEVFDQNNSSNADSVYEDRTPSGTTPLSDIGDEASINDSLPAAYVLYFRIDRFFCRITIDQKTPTSRTQIILFARAMVSGGAAASAEEVRPESVLAVDVSYRLTDTLELTFGAMDAFSPEDSDTGDPARRLDQVSMGLRHRGRTGSFSYDSFFEGAYSWAESGGATEEGAAYRLSTLLTSRTIDLRAEAGHYDVGYHNLEDAENRFGKLSTDVSSDLTIRPVGWLPLDVQAAYTESVLGEDYSSLPEYGTVAGRELSMRYGFSLRKERLPFISIHRGDYSAHDPTMDEDKEAWEFGLNYDLAGLVKGLRSFDVDTFYRMEDLYRDNTTDPDRTEKATFFRVYSTLMPTSKDSVYLRMERRKWDGVDGVGPLVRQTYDLELTSGLKVTSLSGAVLQGTYRRARNENFTEDPLGNWTTNSSFSFQVDLLPGEWKENFPDLTLTLAYTDSDGDVYTGGAFDSETESKEYELKGAWKRGSHMQGEVSFTYTDSGITSATSSTSDLLELKQRYVLYRGSSTHNLSLDWTHDLQDIAGGSPRLDDATLTYSWQHRINRRLWLETALSSSVHNARNEYNQGTGTFQTYREWQVSPGYELRYTLSDTPRWGKLTLLQGFNWGRTLGDVSPAGNSRDFTVSAGLEWFVKGKVNLTWEMAFTDHNDYVDPAQSSRTLAPEIVGGVRLAFAF